MASTSKILLPSCRPGKQQTSHILISSDKDVSSSEESESDFSGWKFQKWGKKTRIWNKSWKGRWVLCKNRTKWSWSSRSSTKWWTLRDWFRRRVRALRTTKLNTCCTFTEVFKRRPSWSMRNSKKATKSAPKNSNLSPTSKTSIPRPINTLMNVLTTNSRTIWTNFLKT